MKDLLDVIAKFTAAFTDRILQFIGLAAVLLFFLSNTKEYNFITKYIVTVLLTH